MMLMGCLIHHSIIQQMTIGHDEVIKVMRAKSKVCCQKVLTPIIGSSNVFKIVHRINPNNHSPITTKLIVGKKKTNLYLRYVPKQGFKLYKIIGLKQRIQLCGI
jgi:hypothetical protein